MPPPGFGQTLAELLTDRLVASGVFRVIDAPRLVATASAAGRTDLDTLFSNAAAVHVDFVVVGSVTRLSLERHTSTHVGFLGVPVVGGLVRKHKTESAIGLTVRVINVHTGEVAAASMAERDAADQHTGGGGVVLAGVVPIIGGRSTSSTGARDRLLDAATQQAVRDVADQIAAAAPRLATYDRE